MPKAIDRLIITSPYEEPKEHWKFNNFTQEFERQEGRRSAGYIRAREGATSLDESGERIDITLVNKIRPRVKKWREEGYPGTTSVTKKLLDFWTNPEDRKDKRLFFAQIEAIETIIWYIEAPANEKTGIDIPSDGGLFQRLCSKMATGTGKTVVMAMLISWCVLNKVTYPLDTRFSKSILIVAPGLTVKERLQVLIPDSERNYYDEFQIVPFEFREKMRQAKVKIINWHMLEPDYGQGGPKVIKKGPESDEAYARRILGELSNSKNILVINDEAHHAWRITPDFDIGLSKDDKYEATKWIEGLDRINKVRGILRCHDFTATPFVPGAKRNGEELLFNWIISDFGLNDSIESGLVKTPRVVVRDDGKLTKNYVSQFYHIYEHVKEDLSKAKPEEPLPALVTNAFYFLGLDWQETYKKWTENGYKIPPVLITVCNRTETAERIEFSFKHRKIKIDELSDESKILRIDSKLLSDAEALESITFEAPEEEEYSPKTVPEKALYLRKVVDTVGKAGEPGEQIRLVISVGMLSEGWDAKNVTHILGLRAFTSQLLCEQVVGRGLRRTSYDVNPETNLFEPEYVNIFGIPFSFIPYEGSSSSPTPERNKTQVRVMPDRSQFEIKFPNIIRINHTYKPKLELDITKTKPLFLSASDTPMIAELAPVIDGKPDVSKIEKIKLQNLAEKKRLQSIIFETARDVYDNINPEWQGNKEYLISQIIKIVEKFINSDKIVFDTLYAYDQLWRKVLLITNMDKIVRHIFSVIRFENTNNLEPIFDRDRPIKSTNDMREWDTLRHCDKTEKCHISHVVYDSTWEKLVAQKFMDNDKVQAWVKNDHLGFEIPYLYFGSRSNYRPDFIVRFKNNKYAVIEVKGKTKERDLSKYDFLEEWIAAVNQNGAFGNWSFAVIDKLGKTLDIINELSKE